MTPMFTSPDTLLPRAVKAIDLGEVLVHFARAKLVISPKSVGAREHFTVHFGPVSKALDVHKTQTTANGAKTYQTLLKITHVDLERMMQELIGPVVESLMYMARPLTLEFMEKMRMGAMVGPTPTQANVTAAVEVRKRRLTINEEKLAAEYSVPKFLDELYDLEEGKIFILISHSNRRHTHRVGFGFPVSDQRNRRRLVWIPDKVMNEQLDRLEKLFQTAAAKYATICDSTPLANASNT